MRQTACNRLPLLEQGHAVCESASFRRCVNAEELPAALCAAALCVAQVAAQNAEQEETRTFTEAMTVRACWLTQCLLTH
jgi:hypothetical protein